MATPDRQKLADIEMLLDEVRSGQFYADYDRSTELLGKATKALAALRAPEADDTSHIDWDELAEIRLGQRNAPSPSAPEAGEAKPVAWCQPMDCGKHTPRKFMIYVEDPDHGIMVFDNEAEARAAFERKNTAWNCYLFGSLPLHAAPVSADAVPASADAVREALEPSIRNYFDSALHWRVGENGRGLDNGLTFIETRDLLTTRLLRGIEQFVAALSTAPVTGADAGLGVSREAIAEIERLTFELKAAKFELEIADNEIERLALAATPQRKE